MVDEFDIPVPIDRARDMLRQKFRANAHIKDTRVIDMLVVKVRYYEECITMSTTNIYHFALSFLTTAFLFLSVLGSAGFAGDCRSLGSSNAHHVKTL